MKSLRAFLVSTAIFFCVSSATNASSTLFYISKEKKLVIPEKTDKSYSVFNAIARNLVTLKSKESVFNALDSLGYLSQEWDSLPVDSMRIRTGNRKVIRFVQILNDSISKNIPFPCRLPCFYDVGLVSAFVKAVGRNYAENGYPFTGFTSSITKNGIDTIIISIAVDKDEKYLFSTPVIKGKIKTSQELLLKDIVAKKSHPFDPKSIETSVARLKTRSYISAVTVGEPIITSKPEDTVRYVAVPFNVVDKSGMGIDGALGFESGQNEKPLLRGELAVSFLNLFRRGETAQLNYSGDKAFQKLSVFLGKPWLFGFPITGEFEGGMEIKTGEYGYLYGNAKGLFDIKVGWQAGIELRGHELAMDSGSRAWNYYGAQLLLRRASEQMQRGVFTHEISFSSGTGAAHREKYYSRYNVDFVGGVHVPVYSLWAMHLKVAALDIITDEADLASAEMYRVGGHETIRGYADRAYAFRSVFYEQLESLLYFNKTSAVYGFIDGGLGFMNSMSLDPDSRRELLGYGVGVRVPSRLGTVTIEWARSIEDRRSFGRMHFALQSALQSGLFTK